MLVGSEIEKTKMLNFKSKADLDVKFCSVNTHFRARNQENANERRGSYGDENSTLYPILV